MISFNSAIVEKLNSLSSTSLNGHYIFSRENDKYLESRYSKPDVYPHNINYGVSSNQKHIEQYYAIREQAYREVLGEKDFSGKEDSFDLISYQYLVTAGSNCVGGVRLTIATPDAPIAVPMESEKFKIKNLFKDIDFSNLKYCEASRLALLPEFRQGHVSNELLVKFIKFLTDDVGVSLGFGRSTALQARRFKSQFQNLNLGYKFVIRNDIKTPTTKSNEHLNLKFWAIDFTKDQRFADSLTSSKSLENIEKSVQFA